MTTSKEDLNISDFKIPIKCKWICHPDIVSFIYNRVLTSCEAGPKSLLLGTNYCVRLLYCYSTP